MTQQEFLDQYHNYQTMWDTDAEAEANKVNAIGIDDDRAVPVQLGKDGMWALMLRSSAAFLRRAGII